MTPKKIPFNYNINRMCAVDLISIIHIDDYDTRFIELHLTDEGEPFAVDGSTVTARFVTVREKYLLSDNVPCAVDGNTITIPIDAAAVQSMSCDIKIEVNIVNGEKILTLPFPLWIRVRGSILQDAEVTPESKGTIPELLEEVKEELARVEGYGNYNKLINKPSINGVTLSGNKSAADLNLQETLPQGNVNEIVAAASNGTMKRSGYSVTTNENVIADRDSANSLVPNARAVAKKLSGITQIKIVSGEVDANGHIKFTDSNGNTFTTTGASIIGADGADGASVVGATINQGLLVLTLQKGSEMWTVTAGYVLGRNGTDGINGAGYVAAEINSDGELVLTFQSAYAPGDSPYEKQVNLGRVVGATGDKGDTYTLTAADKTEIAAEAAGMIDISGKADKADTYTKDEADAAFAGSAAVSKNRAEMTGGAIVPEMERGTIRNNPTDYVDNTPSYIRTKQGYSMWLNPGAVIGLSDYSNAQFFVFLTRPDGTAAKSAVMTGDYIVQEFGFYQMVVSRNPVAALTDADVAALIASIRIDNTAAVGEQGAQATAPLLLGRHPYDYPYVAFAFNASAQTVTMTIPRNSKILIPGGTINLVGDNNSALTVNCVVSNKNGAKIVYDKATQTVKAIAWDSTDSHHVLIAAVSYNFTGSGNSKVQLNVSINAPYRINNRCANMPFSEVLAPIAIGYDSNQRRNYVEVDTVNKTITFPAKTLIFAGEENGFVSVNSGSQLVVGYSDISLGGSNYYGVMKLYFDTATKQIFISPRNSIQFGMYPLVAIVRVPQTTTDTTLPSIAINAPAVIDNRFGGFIDQTQPKNGLIQQISHRGYNTVAPENTLPAFRLAKQMGFDTVETDVQRTADGKYICIHDGSINDRVAQNAGDLTLPVNIADITLAQTQQYDVGKVKGAVSEKYQGTRIPTLEEALQLCRAIGLKMYVELKRETLYTDVSADDQETYVRDIMRIIHTNGMSQHVAIYSGVPELLGFVKAISPGTTLIYGCDAVTSAILSSAIALKSGTNKVVLSVNAANCQKSTDNIENYVAICASNGIQMGAWFASTDGNGNLILNAHPYVSGVMCNSLLPGNVLYDNAIG